VSLLERIFLMDTYVGLPTRCVALSYETLAAEYARWAEHRREVFVLMGEFRQAIAQPRGRNDAIRVLKEILPRLDAYFSVIESLVDKISAAGATPHRSEHRRILGELKSTLQRCNASGAERINADLVHALDELVMHETTISLRAPENTPRIWQAGIPLPA
jgi:hemerythrin